MSNFSHQKKLFNPKNARKVTLFGAGSVGSFTALALAKMGVSEIEVWDADTVESHNAPMSLYSVRDLGRLKVEALRDRIRDLADVEITIRPEMYDGQVPLRNASVVACVDTMQARKTIWSQVKQNPSVDVFLDTRLAEAYVELLAIEPNARNDIGRYDAMMFDDDTAVRQICGTHGIVFASLTAASAVTATLAKFWTERRKTWRYVERCDTLERAS